MTNRKTEYKYIEKDVDELINELISTDDSLKSYYFEEFKKDYSDEYPTRLFYSDISHIARYIVECVKKGKTDFFSKLFEKVENIISRCDTDVENLIVVGLFEDIQNIGGGRDINYYSGFDKWLGKTSKVKWDNLIDAWEGTEWRKNEK